MCGADGDDGGGGGVEWGGSPDPVSQPPCRINTPLIPDTPLSPAASVPLGTTREA